MTQIDLDSLTAPYFHLLVGSKQEFGQYTFTLNYERGPRLAVRVVRGNKMKVLANLFSEFAAALQFPDYFGENWAALDECLSDLEWIPAEGYVLAISDSASLLSDEDPEDRATCVRILLRVRKYWGTEHRVFPSRELKVAPFHVLFHAAESEVEFVREMLKGQCPDIPIVFLRERERVLKTQTVGWDLNCSVKELTLKLLKKFPKGMGFVLGVFVGEIETGKAYGTGQRGSLCRSTGPEDRA